MRLFRPNLSVMERNCDIEGLVKVLLEDPEDELRTQAGQAIARIKTPAAIKLLISGLKTSDVKARIWAAWCLGLLKDPSSISALIEATKDPYQNSSHEYPVRNQAAKALEGMPYQEMRVSMAGKPIEALIETVSFGPSGVRISAAEALGQTKDRRAFEPLVRLLSSGDSQLQNTAINALGKLGDSRAIKYLLRTRPKRSSDYYYSGRETNYVYDAICKIGESGIDVLAEALQLEEVDPEFVMGCFGGIGSSKAIKNIMPWLENTDERIQIASVRALGGIQGSESISVLMNLLAKENPQTSERDRTANWNVTSRLTSRPRDTSGSQVKIKYIEELIISLGRLRSNTSVDLLIRFLFAKDEHLVIVTVDSLASIGDPRAISVFDQIIPNVGDACQEVIARALGNMNKNAGIPLLINLFETGADNVKQAALRSMQQYRSQEFLAALYRFSSSDDPEMNKLVLESISLCNGNMALKLKRMLQDRKPNVRLLAISTCIFSNNYPDKAICEELLLDPEFAVRWGAASLLWLTGEPMENYNLSAALREISTTPRRYLHRYYKAREVLSSGEPRAILALVGHLGHNDILVRKGASKLLLQLGIVAEPILAKALENSNPRIRRRSAELLSEMPRFSGTVHEIYRVVSLMPTTKALLNQALTRERDRDTATMMRKALN